LERETAKEYAAWAERQRREAEARRAALEKQRELEAQSTAPEPEPSLLAAPVPQAEPAPISEPAVAPKQARSHRERWERKCYSVFSGSTRLERRCE
ncbi:MAG TPA: hypothetical protein VK090_05625, partial [Paracoccaceae bacterium]|nr:hypothetical protein [Paracoccaceae bacterium]